MFKMTRTYKGYDGIDRTKDFYFNFNEAEIMEMELSEDGGLIEHIKRISEKRDGKSIIKVMKDIVLKAYGEKSSDGERFVKNDKLREEFTQTRAYSDIFMELALDSKKAAEFINKAISIDTNVEDATA